MSAELTFDDYDFLWQALDRMTKAKAKYLKQPRPDREEIRALTADANQLIREYNERAVQQIFATLQERGEGLCFRCKKIHPAEQIGRYQGVLILAGITPVHTYACDQCEPKRSRFIASIDARLYNSHTHQTTIYLKPKRVLMNYVGVGQSSLQELQQMMRDEKDLSTKISFQLKLPLYVKMAGVFKETYYDLWRV